MIFLAGGPPHLDMFDLKPDAPVEIRGEFSPIKTNVAGIEICELMPKMAAIMDKLAIIRSIVATPHDHAAFHCLTGHPRTTLATPAPQPAGGWPAARCRGLQNPWPRVSVHATVCGFGGKYEVERVG